MWQKAIVSWTKDGWGRLGDQVLHPQRLGQGCCMTRGPKQTGTEGVGGGSVYASNDRTRGGRRPREQGTDVNSGGGGVTPGYRSQLNIRPQDLGSRPCRGPACRSTSGSPGLKRSVALGSWAAGRPQVPRTLGSWSPQAPGNPFHSSAKHIHQMSEPPVSLVLNRITLATTHHQ